MVAMTVPPRPDHGSGRLDSGRLDSGRHGQRQAGQRQAGHGPRGRADTWHRYCGEHHDLIGGGGVGEGSAGRGGGTIGIGAGRAGDGSDELLLSEPGRSPVLDPAQLDVLRRYGTERDVAAGDVLFADGDLTYDLMVMLDGTSELVQGHGRPGAAVIASYGRSQFLGEIGMLTGQRAYLTAVASSAGRVLAVPVAQLRDVMAQEPGVSDLILRNLPAPALDPDAPRSGTDADRIPVSTPTPGGCWRYWRATGWCRRGWTLKPRPGPRRCCVACRCPSPTCRSSSSPAGRC